MLTREQILSANDIRTKTVSVPEWGGDVLVRVLSGRERDTLEADFTSKKGAGLANFRARFAVLCICDESGNRLFTDKDVSELEKKNANTLTLVLEAGMRLNGLTQGDVDELAGNLDAAQSGVSGSD